MGSTSSNTSFKPWSKKSLNESVWISIKFGKSRTSLILEKLRRVRCFPYWTSCPAKSSPPFLHSRPALQVVHFKYLSSAFFSCLSHWQVIKHQDPLSWLMISEKFILWIFRTFKYALQHLKILKISTKIAAKSDRKNVDLTAVSLDWTIFQPSKTTNSCLYYT